MPDRNSVSVFERQLAERMDVIEGALPQHVTAKQFQSVVLQAVMQDPDLRDADRGSLMLACLAAASSGLLPDKKEAAFVLFRTKVKRNNSDVWIDKVQFMPMIRGLFTQLYNTGKVKSAKAGLVYAGDAFRAWEDDEGEHIFYEEGADQDRNHLQRAYAAVWMKDGSVFVETMRAEELDKVKGTTKSRDRNKNIVGPWSDWEEEMQKKTVFRRLSKRLPLSRDDRRLLEQTIAHDNVLYDQLAQVSGPAGGRSLGQEMRALASLPAQSSSPAAVDPHTAVDGAAASSEVPRHQTEDAATHSPDQARERGAAARADGRSRKAVPPEYRNDERLLEAYLEGFDSDAGKGADQ